MEPEHIQHAVIQALKKLIPEVTVVGGSFAGNLPHPKTIRRSERQTTFRSARHEAKNHYINLLLRGMNLTEPFQIDRGVGGEIIWPQGFVGSLTDKGTLVLAAMAPVSVVRALGIDLEYIDESDLSEISKLIGKEDIPTLNDSQATLLTLSAKEAAFKAQYCLTGNLLTFSDVILNWTLIAPGIFSAEATCTGGIILKVRSAIVHPWIASAAVSLS